MQAARGPRAIPALGLAAFLESFLLPVPIDLVLAPIVLGRAHAFWKIVLVGALASLAGAFASYLAGALVMESLGSWLTGLYATPEEIRAFEAAYARWGWMVVAAAGITAIPFKAVCFLSGMAALAPVLFLATAFGIRLLRFFMIAGLIRLAGPPLVRILERHAGLFAIVMIGLMVLAAPLLLLGTEEMLRP